MDRFAGCSALSGPGPAPQEGRSPVRPSDPPLTSLCRSLRSCLIRGGAPVLPGPRRLAGLCRPHGGHAAGLLLCRCLVAVKCYQFQLRELKVPSWMECSPSLSGTKIVANTSGGRSRELSSERGPLTDEFEAFPTSGPGPGSGLSAERTERFPCGGPGRGRVQSALAPPWSRGRSHLVAVPGRGCAWLSPRLGP